MLWSAAAGRASARSTSTSMNHILYGVCSLVDATVSLKSHNMQALKAGAA